MKRVQVFREGLLKGGKLVVVPESFSEFLREAGRKLGIEAMRVYLRAGDESQVEVESCDEIRDGDCLMIAGVSASDESMLEGLLTLNSGVYVEGNDDDVGLLNAKDPTRLILSTLAQLLHKVEDLSHQVEKLAAQRVTTSAGHTSGESRISGGSAASSAPRASQTMASRKPKQVYQHAATLAGHSGPVWCLYPLERRGIILSGSADTTIKAWGIDDNKIRNTLRGHTGIVHALLAKPKGNTLFSASEDKTIKVWNLNKLECIATIQETDSVLSLALDGSHLFSGSYHCIRVFDSVKYTLVGTLTGHHHWVRALHVAEGYIFSGCHNLILIHNTKTLALIRSIPTGGVGRSIYSLTIVRNLLFSATYDNIIAVYDLQTFELKQTLVGHQGAIYAIRAYKGLLITGSYDQSLRVWNESDGQCLQVIKEAHDSKVEDVAVISNGSLYSCSSDGTIKVWQHV